MPESSSILCQFSDALSALVTQARSFVASIEHADGWRGSGVLWRGNVVVASEQALPRDAEYEVLVAGELVKAQIAGRDPGVNVAILRLEREIASALPNFAKANAGALAVILGAAGEGVSARLAMLRSVGAPWESMAGATIDQRIVLDSTIGQDEGGPVLAADGRLFGISTRGARRQSLVIPASNVEKSVSLFLEQGGVKRGHLGVALRPVAIPESLRPGDGQRIGLMVMEVESGGPAGMAGILAGDILLSVGGAPAIRFGQLTRQLGANSIGRKVEVRFARAGQVEKRELTIAERAPG